MTMKIVPIFIADLYGLINFTGNILAQEKAQTRAQGGRRMKTVIYQGLAYMVKSKLSPPEKIAIFLPVAHLISHCNISEITGAAGKN